MARTSIVWFRQDLRLTDNPALTAAAKSGLPVVAVYVLDEAPARLRQPGGASRWWLHHSLEALAGELETLGVPLVLRRGQAAEILPQLCREAEAAQVFWNRLYEPAAVERDRALKAALTGHGVEVRSFNASLLHEPWTVTTGAGRPYSVFTPFWKAVLAKGDPGPAVARPRSIESHKTRPGSERLADWGLLPTAPDWARGLQAAWEPGEAGARDRLLAFLEGVVDRYRTDRDRPSVAGTSGLSPHLHFGEIGPRQIWSAASDAARRGEADDGAVMAFLRELGWRDFCASLLFHNPELPTANLRRDFDTFPWREDPAGLKAWQAGCTGFPIVDAGMRELWATGWMHNRVRMVAASFLIKDLLIHWREGEDWFWDTLVDADPANNAANWQWVAGSGADAAPFFRIFNPMLQGEKFDPAGDYVRRWVPALAKLPAKAIHAPWTADAETLRRAGVRLGETYPHPIVDHKAARERALDAFRRIGKG